ncbi:MAG: hypothetical protein IPM53_04335 [Anaerolineaceae bacterium]|nr:hypothetical protein [Anaerolineaceae bacterium]
MTNTSNGSHQIGMKAIPNAEMLSRQIESLRVVVRRMKAYESSTLNSLINQKLKEMQ